MLLYKTLLNILPKYNLFVMIVAKKILVFCCILFVWACSPKPYATTNKVYTTQSKTYAKTLQQQPFIEANDSMLAPNFFAGTTNFSMRKPNFVIIHHTAQNSCEQTLKTFTLTRTQVSAHYVICRDGIVHHMLNDYMRAHHAGQSKWGSVTDMNSCSIGIELDNNGFEPFSDAQMKSLLSLLGKLKTNYSIPTANFIGHGDIAPTRKNDPSILFPWKTLANQGFGHWYDEIKDDTPANFNHLQALKIIGYDTKDTTAAIRSFKRHFMQDSTKKINDADKVVLNNLMKKY
jgi:N-acetylmuramoyl-L-alanine amidase